jgi:hypothetical protein
LIDCAHVGIRVNLDEVKVGLVPPKAIDLDEAVGEAAGLDELGLECPPRANVMGTAQAKDGVAVMLDKPLTAFVVFVHWFLPDNAHDLPLEEIPNT